MRFIFKMISRLFALVMMIFTLLYAYGAYLHKQAEKKDSALDARIRSGNGFGGEAGMKIIDSEFSANEFFWIDSDHLLFKIHISTPENRNNRGNYIWNILTGEILPLDIDGSGSCVRDGYFYFYKVLNPNRRSGERSIVETFRSKLVRRADQWSVEETQNIKDVWPDIPDRHEYAWRDGHECKLWYYLPRENRLATDTVHHYFRYLSEWGWVYRRPIGGKLEPDDGSPPAGFFEIGNQIYKGQTGVMKGPSPEIPNLRDIDIRYASFLDSYWIASRLNLNFSKPKYLGLLGRDGRIVRLSWSEDWPFYDAIPVPTKKGIFWDSRNPGQGRNQSGGYLLDVDNQVHKVIHGAVEYLEVSPDGCMVAFHNRPKDTATGNSRLRIFNACTSSIQGREMTDVDYRDRPG